MRLFTGLLLVLLTITAHVSNAQLDTSLSFYAAAEQFYAEHEDEELTRVKGYKQFKRWEAFNGPRCYPTGHPPVPNLIWKEWKKSNLRSGEKAAGNWQLIGPQQIPNNGGGMGRVNCIEFDPLDANEVWVGTPDGGVWKSTDGGVSWSTQSDQLVNLGVADIAINPFNSDTMYLATGDGYGYGTGEGFWGGTYSHGILRSVDGGSTWQTTGMNWDVTQTRQVFSLSIDPLAPQNLVATTSNGIWLTNNSGDTWVQTAFGNYKDVEHNLANPGIVYVTGDSGAHRSTDGGLTWNPMGLSGFADAAIAVTPANPLMIGLFAGDGNFFRSDDEGLTWGPATPTFAGAYGWYTAALTISETDENTILVGGLDVHKSTDGGNTWYPTSDWLGWPATNYSHADHRALKFVPGSSTTVLNGNDGGVFKSSDLGATWVDLSHDLVITQLYRIGGDPTNSNVVFAGAQDNGVVRMDGSTSQMVLLADGMEAVVDYNNPLTVYACAQNGWLHMSTDGGFSFFDIDPYLNAAWVAPLVIHPTDPSIIYYGAEDLYEITGGLLSGNLSMGAGGFNTLHSITVCQDDPDHIYFIRGSTLSGGMPSVLKTNDGGANWINISGGLPVLNAYASWIAVDPHDPNRVYVTFSGYEAAEKVYVTTDGGINWTNISGSLPNIPVNCIAVEGGLDNGIYIGTDFGVYYLHDGLPDWTAFSDGLPNVVISELEIDYPSLKLRAATYGRGVWESDLDHFTGVNPIAEKVIFSAYPSPTNGVITIKGDFSSVANGTLSVLDMLGREVFQTPVNPSFETWELDLSGHSAGQYTIRFTDDTRLINRPFILAP